MALDTHTKLAIQAKLRLNVSPKDIADQLDVKLPTVYKISQDLKRQISDEAITGISDIPIETITHVVEEAKKTLPMSTPGQQSPMIDDLDRTLEVLSGLKALDKSFQATMTNVLGRFDEKLNDKEITIKDLVTISNTTANAYEKIFSSGTNIHIGDNNSSNNQLTVFQNKKGV